MSETPLAAARGLVNLFVLFDRKLGSSSEATPAETAAEVAALAVRHIPGVDQASITERRSGNFYTLATTGPMAATADSIQYELNSGPCVDAILDDTVYSTGDVATDSRWPEFGARAFRETGAHSMLSHRLYHQDQPERATGLNLYSARPHAFGENAETVATVLATHSARVLAAAAARDRAANLERALVSNRRIGAAVGILMATHKITEDDAFQLLRVASQNTNKKLADIAEHVVTTGALEPSPR